MPQIQLRGILSRVSRPARYAGGEWNAVVKDWDGTAVRIALAYPDVYDVGMSNLGLAILYDILNREPDVVAERVYAPWSDMEEVLRAEGLPLFSLETRHPLGEFHVLGFSLSYELTYANVLTMLDLADIPILAAERGEGCPLVIAGGSGALNPEPLADFVDAFFLGDGEEAVLDLVAVLREWKGQGGGPRAELVRRLAGIPGVYVPSLYQVGYHPGGKVREVVPADPAAPARVRKRFVQALLPPPTRPIVPYVQTVHDRAAIEIQRGCTQGCRFCQAGMIYRPRLERSPDEVVRAARELLASTGYDELSLLSLSTTDHSQIVEMVGALRAEFGERLAISLPSMRVDTFSVALADVAASRGKHTITFAPEAGTERLRHVINKLVSEDDLYQAVEAAFSRGWTGVKLYYMVGLPGEEMEDVVGIVEQVRRVREIGRRHQGGRARVRVSAADFIPKAHTPFQWAGQMTREELVPRHEHLRRELKRLGVAFSWEDPEKSLLEAVLSRGDRRLGPAIRRAWELGARFDAWGESYDWSRWQRALGECGLDPAFYAHRERDLFEVFPWAHIDSGVSEGFLRGEWLRAGRGETTADCHREPCNVCGVQDTGAAGCEAKLEELIDRRRAAKAAPVEGVGMPRRDP